MIFAENNLQIDLATYENKIVFIKRKRKRPLNGILHRIKIL